MYRILSMAVVVALVAVMAGCDNGDNGGGRSKWFGGDIGDNQWGSGMTALWDSSTYDTQVLQACHDLRDAKMGVNRMNAAKRLGDLKPTSNFAIECLEDGCKDEVNDVRLASADALQRIGTDNALHHLKEAQEKGYVPSGTINWPGTSGAAYTGTTTQPADTSTETKVEVKTKTNTNVNDKSID